MWRREGDGWVVGLESSRSFVRDSKGMMHLEHLLTRPDEEVSALDLVAAQEGTVAASAADAGPLLDARAKAEYRARMEALAARIAEAERLGDAERSAAAQAEFDFLAAELKGAIGLGGRDRKVGSNVERARVNVTRSIRAAIDRIKRHDPELAGHLDACVRTGAFCVYDPHLDAPVRWDRSGEPAPPAETETPGSEDALLTVMFLDIEDSTSIMERLGEHEWLELLALHNAIVRSQLDRHGGREVKAMGDGFMVTFGDVRRALWCAADLQRELERHSEREPERPLRVRVGVHVGDAVREGGDVFGRTVVVAARLSQQARGGQVLVSDAVVEAIGPDLGDLGLASLKVVQLRGLRGLHRVHELLWKPGAVPPTALGTSPDKASEELFERDLELAALRSALETARDGVGSVVLIDGPPGIGKSTLMLRLLEDAEQAGMNTLRARATRLEADSPFGAARRLFTRALRGLEDERRAALLQGAVKPAAAMLGHEEPVAETFFGESHAMHIFNGLFWLTAALAEERPMLIALDDAHWADPQTLEWIEYAAGRLAEVPVLIVVSGRGGVDSPLRGVAAAAPGGVISLRPLSEGAVHAAVRAVWPEATRGFAHACHVASSGNPFFLREIIATAHRDGIPPTDAGAGRLPEVRPDSVSRMVLTRVTELGDEARTLARALAVLGGRADLSLVAQLAELDPTTALAAADALDRADIIEGAAQIAFAHPLIGAVMEQDLHAGERALLHERAAHLLRERGALPELVAVHLLHSRPAASETSVATLREAARAAGRHGAPASAARLLERAVAEPPAAEELPVVLLELGRALQDAGSDAEAVAVLEQAMRLAGTTSLRGEILLTLCGFEDHQDLARRIAQIDDMIAQLDEDDRELRFALEARAIELLGDLMMSTPSPQMTTAHDERLRGAVSQAQGGSAGERQLIAISAVHRVIRASIPAAEARALALRALDDGTLARRLATGAWSADSAIEVLSVTDAFEEADRHARNVERYARESGMVTAEAYACQLRAMIALHRGALADVESLLRSVFAITRQLGGPKYVDYVAQQVRTCSAIERGDLDAATRSAEALARDGVRPWGAPLALGRLYAARGEHELAVAALSAAHDMHRTAGIWRTITMGSPAPDLVLSLVAIGNREDALAIAQEELAHARRFGAPSAVGNALRALAHADDPSRAIEHLTEATDVLAPSLALLVRGQVLCDLGSSLRAAGDTHGSRHALRQALEISVRCAARRLADRVTGELSLAGVRQREHQVTGRELLSPGERRVAELAAEGAADLEIAQALFLSPRAVAEQLATAIGKLGVSSREELGEAMRETALVA